MVTFIRNFFRELQVKKAVKKANQWAKLTGHRYIVYWYKGKPVVKPKYELKNLIKKGVFAKGTTIQKIQDNAIHVTA